MKSVFGKVAAVAFALGLVSTIGLSRASAQFIVNGPGGSIGFSNGNGTYTYVYPSRLNPGANQAVPGSQQNTPWGPIWLGQDGAVHGNIIDPNGNMHVMAAPPKGLVSTHSTGSAMVNPTVSPSLSTSKPPLSVIPRRTR